MFYANENVCVYVLNTLWHQ